MFLPPKIINKVQEIKNHTYAPHDILFFIGCVGWEDVRIIKRLPITICFLATTLETSGIRKWMFNDSGFDSKFYFIIDAWRGPTFSDEEARLP